MAERKHYEYQGTWLNQVNYPRLMLETAAKTADELAFGKISEGMLSTTRGIIAGAIILNDPSLRHRFRNSLIRNGIVKSFKFLGSKECFSGSSL